jgi:hypothetical protein
VSLVAMPKAPTQLLGFDVSCQLATFDVLLPQAVLGDNSYLRSLTGPNVAYATTGGQTGVDIDLSVYSPSLVPRFRRFAAATTSGTSHWWHAAV